jgi:hypothetical protein
MTCNYKKSTKQMLFASSFALLMLFSGMHSIQHAFADDTKNEFIPVASDRIKNDPFLVKILENIEQSKKEFSDIQEQNIQKQLIDDQRNIAKSIAEKELQQMFKDNEDFTPLNSFNRFLDKVSNDETKIIFQGLFDYKEDRVNAARNAMKEVFKNGGSLLDARNAYHEAAKIPRVDMIQLVQDLNIKAGFSDPDIQQHFSNEGKLPRYDNEYPSALSFVDYTTSAKNVNSSTTEIQETTEFLENTETQEATNSSDDASSESSESTLVQKLLDEIQFLKNKITELEKNTNSELQQVVFGQKNNDSMYFADWLISSSQGVNSDGNSIIDARSAPHMVLNEPDSYDKTESYFSLGKQGEVVVQFSQPVSGELTIFEASWKQYATETSSVKVSTDGENWVLLNKVKYNNQRPNVHEFTYDISEIGCIEFVKIIDSSLSNTASKDNGFDVDAIGATQTCTDIT